MVWNFLFFLVILKVNEKIDTILNKYLNKMLEMAF